MLYNERLFLDVNETGYLIVGAQGRTEYREQVSVAPIVAGQWMHVAVVLNRGAPCSTQDDPVSQEPRRLIEAEGTPRSVPRSRCTSTE